MKKNFWQQLENAESGCRLTTSDVLKQLRFNEAGLLPVVSQCADSGRVLMLAWMNQEALRYTLEEGVMIYYSRSRQTLWRKGETSGCVQQLCKMAIDCDGDSLLATVKQTGNACHTGRLSCFYWIVEGEQVIVKADGS